MNILDTLRALRAEYGAEMSDNECADLVNAACWVHRAEGFGVSNKDGGTKGYRYDGEDICHDVVMLKDGSYWDVLTAAGKASGVIGGETLGAPGKITDTTRYWIAPIPPKGAGTGPVVKPPVVVPPPAAGVALADIREVVRAQLGELEARLAAQLASQVAEAVVRSLAGTGAVSELLDLARQQEKRREELAVHTDAVIVARTKGWPLRLSNRLFGTLSGTVGDPSQDGR